MLPNPFACAERSVLVLSSRACPGGRAAAAGIVERIDRAVHHDIEDLIGPSLCAADFAAPPRTSFAYRWRLLRAERHRDLSQLSVLTALVRRGRIRTVIATNHRAAFWVAELRRRGAVDCALWALMPHFHLDAGWTHLPWDEIDRFLTPLPASALPLAEQRVRYRRVALPVARGYGRLADTPVDRRRILVAAGAGSTSPPSSSTRASTRAYSSRVARTRRCTGARSSASPPSRACTSSAPSRRCGR